MKKSKLLLGTFATIAAVSLGGMYVSANSTDSNMITIVTDKSEYSANESISETVILENTSGRTLTDITLVGNVPDGYKLSEGTEKTWTETITKLKAGESKTLDSKKIKVVESTVNTDNKTNVSTNPTPTKPTTQTSQTNPVKTGDYFQFIFWIAVAGFGLTGIAVAIRNKKTKQILSLALAIALAGGMFPVDMITANAEENDTFALEQSASKTIKIDGKEVILKVKMTCSKDNRPVKTEDDLLKEGYTLKWQDEFEGNSLNRDDWNVELHEPGWVNEELQEYVDSDKNIYVEDGNLIIKPIETVNEDGTKSYTSGRVNTQNKHDFKYGYFECRAKVPTGKGYLPAFWMMPTDENLYGQWPKCGEIDIMEVMGDATNKAYGTIHYGEPHAQSQGTFNVDDDENFSDNYHTYACEWEPGKIIWYIDGIKYHEECDWFSTKEGQGTVTYPAPFDQPFYMILNLAIGGSWVGYPDETTTYEDQQFTIDYVKVYQKEENCYNEDIEKPVKNVTLRDPDETGNYIINGDFTVAEDLNDSIDWTFLNAKAGEGSAEIKNNQIIIKTTNAGSEDYSIQLVQPNLPMQKGAKYKLTFDAYADEARTMITDISAPDYNYIRYFDDKTVNLTTSRQTYSYEFQMKSANDANGRLEFNLGKTASTATVYISKIRLEKIGYEEIKEDTSKKALADGNFVYNGEFQEGTGRLGFWEINKDDASQISVTNKNNVRQLKIVASNAVNSDNPITIGQSELALSEGTNYAMSFIANGDEGKVLNISVGGNDFTATLIGKEKSFKETFTLSSSRSVNKDLVFSITEPGTYYLDNVRIEEDALIKNGNFNAGLSGFDAYCKTPSNVTCVVDSLKEDNAADFTIRDTGDAAWHIQLKQSGVKLEKDQWYKISMKMKSSIDRKVSFALQRDGSKHKNADGSEDWTPYCEEIVTLGNDYQTYTKEFKMTMDTDIETIFNIAMGAVDGKQITDQHRICIDDIVLEKIDAPEQKEPEIEPMPINTNLFRNADFSSGSEGWESAIWGTVEGTSVLKDGTATFDLKKVGAEDYMPQLKQQNLQFENGQKYKVSMNINSTVARKIVLKVQKDGGDWYVYHSKQVDLKVGDNEVSTEFVMDKATDPKALFCVAMGAQTDLPAHVLKISDLKLIKVDNNSDESNDTNDSEKPGDTTNTNILKNADFSDGLNNWDKSLLYGNTIEPGDNKAIVSIKDLGKETEEHSCQLIQKNLSVKKGSKYEIKFKADSTVARKIKFALMVPEVYDWYTGDDITLKEGINEYCKEVTINKDSTDNIAFYLTMGYLNEALGEHTITISDVSIREVK